VGNVAAAVRCFQDAGLWTIGLDVGGESTIYDSPLPPRCLLVVGGEGKGLARTTAAACDEMLRIPIRGRSGSLNASVALSIAMFEWARVNVS
jgi:23S rRNA (guanosine2251-2'-O)-methyltransferase